MKSNAVKDIEEMISNFRINDPFWLRYREGDCAFFAMALHDIIGLHESTIVSLWVDIGTAKSPCWLHDTVHWNGFLWDVDGPATIAEKLKSWEKREEGRGFYWKQGTGIEKEYEIKLEDVRLLKHQILGKIYA